jgi:prophage antirepressor-like protein
MNRDKSMLNLFQFEGNELRFVDGKPVANDVAKTLGYVDPASTVSKKVKPKYKGVVKMETPGGVQSVTVLEEAGIYQLIIGSQLPIADKFQDWLFEEVLPSIRKTGSYQIQKPKSAIELAKENLKLAQQNLFLLEEMERKDIVIESLEKDNEHLATAVDELFSYSSIVRIAKFNKVCEKHFSWRRLKAVSEQMGLEIKQVPCPRFVTKNLYSHDVWRIAYPEFILPETTTLTIVN